MDEDLMKTIARLRAFQNSDIIAAGAEDQLDRWSVDWHEPGFDLAVLEAEGGRLYVRAWQESHHNGASYGERRREVVGEERTTFLRMEVERRIKRARIKALDMAQAERDKGDIARIFSTAGIGDLIPSACRSGLDSGRRSR